MSTIAIKSKDSRPKMAIVSQEPALFNRTVIDNVKYNMDSSFSDVEDATKLSDAFGFIEEGNFGQ